MGLYMVGPYLDMVGRFCSDDRHLIKIQLGPHFMPQLIIIDPSFCRKNQLVNKIS